MAIGDSYKFQLSKVDIRDRSDEEILATFTRGFFSGWIFTPERYLIGSLRSFGIKFIPCGYSNISSPGPLLELESISSSVLPPKHSHLFAGNFMVLFAKTENNRLENSPSCVEIGYGDDRKQFSGMHSFELIHKGDGAIIWYSSVSCNPSVNKRPFPAPNVLPKHLYERLVKEHKPKSKVSGCSVEVSYEAAVRECEARVTAIVTECRRNNIKYTDDEFDLDDKDYCLKPLTATTPDISNGGENIEKGFPKKVENARRVITRTGTVKLTARKVREPACAKRVGEIFEDPKFFIDHDAHAQDIRQGSEGYKKTYQTGSDALFFGSCADPNETWVPLIEKAFAKVHGDYDSINGGWPGEGVEDLTGGVTTKFISSDILDKDSFWTQGLMKVGKDFIFSAGTKEFNCPDPDQLGRQGVEDDHAYSVLRAAEYQENRLCLIKNPWGETEWNGPWSDGSKEWTKESLDALHHKFGDEALDYRQRALVRRLQRNLIPLHAPRPTTTVIVLSQLDARYFGGLTGQYTYSLSFNLHTPGQNPHTIRGYPSGDRSATTEIFLQAGSYEVFLQITGHRDATLPKIEDVVQQNWLARRQKLIQIALKHDMAHAKGMLHHEPSNQQPRSPINHTTSHILTPPATPRIAPATLRHRSKNESDTTEAPWNTSCVVGLKIYTYQSIAAIGVGRAGKFEAAQIEIGGVEGEREREQEGFR
ncbi:hypothetical protein DID88_009849 [Monilinia fructigena]|uniref:Calpain catalytic domain-containing protein n=1 Tax=Monilinia fructigena TaxID=38457 RepID=A0A395ILJ7_9HELO|nr:hypothetical protein DID88_009849 [Monilinia fructigena]